MGVKEYLNKKQNLKILGGILAVMLLSLYFLLCNFQARLYLLVMYALLV